MPSPENQTQEKPVLSELSNLLNGVGLHYRKSEGLDEVVSSKADALRRNGQKEISVREVRILLDDFFKDKKESVPPVNGVRQDAISIIWNRINSTLARTV
jgi:hypothetical protein